MNKIDIKSLIIGVLGTIIILFSIGASSYYDIDDIMLRLDDIESKVMLTLITVDNIESDVSYIKRYGVDCN